MNCLLYVAREDLEDTTIRSAPVNISWTRVGQYLPWMQMGDRPGKLVYHVRGYKVLKGLEALPPKLLGGQSMLQDQNFDFA